jgi:aspartate/methionine/tyrosine aminotransferase
MRKIRRSVREAAYSVREISELAATMDDVVHFDIGQPNFGTPDVAKTAAQRAIQQKDITYTPLWGIDDLRDEIARYESHKADPGRENVMVTTGGIGALYSIFATIAESGDSILFNDPCWPVYQMITRCSTASFSQTPYFRDGGLDVDSIRQSITDKTAAIVVNNPQNPTGRVYDRDELEKIAAIARDEDIWLIGDEVYDRLTFGRDHVSVADVAPEQSLIVNSMSKNFAMTGWRIGWVLCPDEELLHHMGKLNRSTTACPNFVAQHASLRALQDATDYVETMREAYRERKDLVEQELEELGLSHVAPDGAIYVFPDVGEDSWTFARGLLREQKVAVVPGEPSGPSSDTNVRICFGSVGTERIREGMRRMKSYLD